MLLRSRYNWVVDFVQRYSRILVSVARAGRLRRGLLRRPGIERLEVGNYRRADVAT